MKRLLVAVAMLIAITGIRNVNAQSADTVNVTIPFGFAVSNQTLQAGDYQLRRSIEGSRVVVKLLSKVDQKSIYLPIHSARGLDIQSTSKLIFHQYGDKYFLWQIRIAGRSDYQELSRTKREQSIQRNLAMKSRAAGIIEVAGNE